VVLQVMGNLEGADSRQRTSGCRLCWLRGPATVDADSRLHRGGVVMHPAGDVAALQAGRLATSISADLGDTHKAHVLYLLLHPDGTSARIFKASYL
jgi:hypothetical protein